MNSRLTGKIRNFDGSATSIKPIADDKGFPNKFGSDVLTKLADYEDLEEQGRLLKLPCNRGDKIYFIKSAFSIAHFPIEAKITSICGVDCDNDVMYSSITEYNKIDRRFKSSDIGKTVFLTKEEAEAKLKELKGE